MNLSALLDTWRRVLNTPGALRNASDRAQLGATLAAFARQGSHELAAQAPDFIEAATLFRRALERDQLGVLDIGLCWTDEEQAFAQWAASACDRVSAVIASTAEGPCARVKEQVAVKPIATELVAATLAVTGDAIKWNAIAAIARPTALLARANRSLRLAEWAGIATEEAIVEAENDKLSRNTPQLYTRVMLLDFLASGNLSRQQIEVADAWLLRWVRDYPLTMARPAVAPSLWVDAARNDGLRTGTRRDGTDVRHVSLAALKDQLEAVTRSFHAGRIFPGSGIATTFRLEEHIAVIDHWQRVLGQLASAGPARSSERLAAEDATVEAFIGVNEVFQRGFAKTFEVSVDIQRRWVALRDSSTAGLGLAVGRGEHGDVNVGDLIAVREPEGKLAVGEVARRAPNTQGGAVLGVLVHSREARPVALRRIAGEDGRGAMQVEAVFVPGADACGRGDSLVVSDTAYAPRGRYALELGEVEFEVALNRARRKGRGWVSCGIEVLTRKELRPLRLAS